MVIDVVSIFLYAKRGMPWGAFLFAVYTLLAVDGWFDGIAWFTLTDDELHRNGVLHRNRLSALLTRLKLGQAFHHALSFFV